MSTVNANSFKNATADGPPDFPLGLTSEGNPVGGLKEWAVLTDYNEGDVVYSGGADATLIKYIRRLAHTLAVSYPCWLILLSGQS